MGFSEKPQKVDGCLLESEGSKKWVIAGKSLRPSLKPITTNKRIPKNRAQQFDEKDDDTEEETCSTTPTSEESRIPEKLACPPAPRKRRPPSRCHSNGVVRDFFTPPDLEAIFLKRHVERTTN